MPTFHKDLIEKVKLNTKLSMDTKFEKIALQKQFGITVPEETKLMENETLERATFLAFNKIRQNPGWLQMELENIVNCCIKNEKLKKKKMLRYSLE